MLVTLYFGDTCNHSLTVAIRHRYDNKLPMGACGRSPWERAHINAQQCFPLSATRMSTSLDEIPHEILSSIVSYLWKDPKSLLSLLKTARFLHPHAEYHLYHTVDCAGGTSRAQTVRFLKTIELHPRLGSLVTSFYPYIIEHNSPFEQPKEFVDLFLSAMRFMPNLKSLKFVQDRHEVPKALQWGQGVDLSQHLPFQLDRLEVRLEWYPFAFWDDWDPQRFAEDLLQLLQHQEALRHFSLVLDMDREQGGQAITSLPSEDSLEQWREACSSLEVLEGTNSTMRLLLPNTQNVKALFWQYDSFNAESFRSPNDLDTDHVLREDFFTPSHCEAYGRLENLAIGRQITLLPILSTYLTSLETLVLIAEVSRLGRPGSDGPEEGLFMQSIGALKQLVTLVVIQSCDLNLDYEAIFAACGKLQRLSLCELRDGEHCFESVAMERSEDGVIRPIEWIFGEETPRMPYVGAGWFFLGTQDLV